MALHRGQRLGFVEVGPRVRRFEYMERMDEDEADQQAAAQQRAQAYRHSLPPVEPDEIVEVNGSEVKVFLNEKAREMARRDMAAKALREGKR